MTQRTIDITPVLNEAAIKRYAEKHQTDQPQAHISGELAALARLSAKYDELSETLWGDELAWAFVNAFGDEHRMVSNELAGMFGQDRFRPGT